jgi:hypothetical protein
VKVTAVIVESSACFITTFTPGRGESVPRSVTRPRIAPSWAYPGKGNAAGRRRRARMVRDDAFMKVGSIE